MPAVARIGDPFADDDTVAAGSGDVFINNIPCARLSDATMGHPCPPGWWPATTIAEGSGSVFVNNMPVARVGDEHLGHWCGTSFHTSPIAEGSGDVFAG